jgi:hypothetical protein
LTSVARGAYGAAASSDLGAGFAFSGEGFRSKDLYAPSPPEAGETKASQALLRFCSLLLVEAVQFARKNEFAVAKAHGTEIANALARGVM